MSARDTELLIRDLERVPIEKQGLVVREALREIGEKDLFFFTKHLLGYRDMLWRTHREPVLVLESDAVRKLVIMPRGTFKSTLVSVAYPLWCLARNPNRTILLDSEVFTNSKNFLREIRTHMSANKRINCVWGPWTGPIDNEGEVTIGQRTANRKEASITVGGIETVKVGQHYDMIIGDDYNSPKNSDTPEKCRKVIDHVRYNLNILNPGGEYCFAMTRYAELDIAGWALAEILGEKGMAEGKLVKPKREPRADDRQVDALELNV